MQEGSDQNGEGCAIRKIWLLLWAERPVHTLMSLLPGEWVWLKSPGVGAMGKEARLGAGRLCREQTWLNSSLGYPGEGEETLGCHRLSPGRAGTPGAGTSPSLAEAPVKPAAPHGTQTPDFGEELGTLLPFVIPQFSSTADFLPRGETRWGKRSQLPCAHHHPSPHPHCMRGCTPWDLVSSWMKLPQFGEVMLSPPRAKQGTRQDQPLPVTEESQEQEAGAEEHKATNEQHHQQRGTWGGRAVSAPWAPISPLCTHESQEPTWGH